MKSEIAGSNTMNSLSEIKEGIVNINAKIDELISRMDTLTKLLLPEDKPELVKHLQDTMSAILKLDENTKGFPISRNELAVELEIHSNTAYIRAEKLVKRKKLAKFYGRELGFERFEEKKAVFYTIPRTLYDQKFRARLEKWNKPAFNIAITLLQQQPLSEQMLNETGNLPSKELKEGINFLLNRGLITKDKKEETIHFGIRKIDTEEPSV
jgi:hypothetical protein